MNEETNYQVGIYCRLSKDDEQPGESSSIGTQRAMLLDYCSEHGYAVFDVYIDDGFTGTNFEREAFQRLLKDIDSGHINMVMTKDLSRLGRDYIQMGYYTEIYFPSKGVRYIALSDGFDSEKERNDIAPFMNILNDMYARDISRKVKAAKLQRAKNGLLTASEAPYGYKKASGRLEIDPEAARQVRFIFEMAEKGYGAVTIARELEQQNILRPKIYKIATGQIHPSEQDAAAAGDCAWSYHTVGAILSNRVYLGELRTHKTEVVNHKTKQKRAIPEEEQFVSFHAHPAIIDEDLFRRVQEIRAGHRCPARMHRAHMFRGILYCDCCRHPLSVAHRTLKDRDDDLYRCAYHYHHPEACPQTHAIYHSQLYSFVLQQLQALAKSMKRRKVDAPIAQYANTTELTQEILSEVIERIEVSHLGRRTRAKNAVKIIWKL